MGYIINRATSKWWYQHTNRLKYYSLDFFDEHNNKFGKSWSPGSELMLSTNIYILLTLKFDLLYI